MNPIPSVTATTHLLVPSTTCHRHSTSPTAAAITTTIAFHHLPPPTTTLHHLQINNQHPPKIPKSLKTNSSTKSINNRLNKIDIHEYPHSNLSLNCSAIKSPIFHHLQPPIFHHLEPSTSTAANNHHQPRTHLQSNLPPPIPSPPLKPPSRSEKVGVDREREEREREHV
ncbi:hypothetical protein HanPSC8_Chr06g0237791 [Helianthus annuus]|nr:hypothetical protein HanPSC8_Chr06g0237791 [Helianthus annuus]